MIRHQHVGAQTVFVLGELMQVAGIVVTGFANVTALQDVQKDSGEVGAWTAGYYGTMTKNGMEGK